MSPRPQWSFISNHGAVLSMVDYYGLITARKIADELGITERAVRRIIRDLEEQAYLTRERDGRVNRYRVDRSKPLRRQDAAGLTVGDLLELLRRRYE